MIPVCAFSAILLMASGGAPADRIPSPNSYGFNWLDANSQCSKLTDKDLANAKACESSDNAFGLQIHSHLCKVSDRVELMVYKTEAQCKEALETMQANGP